MLKNETQTSLEICKSHWNLYTQNDEMVMIMHKSLLYFIFIFIFASWTDPPQVLFRHIKVTYTPIVVQSPTTPFITSIQSTLPVLRRHHHHSFLYIPDICSRPHLLHICLRSVFVFATFRLPSSCLPSSSPTSSFRFPATWIFLGCPAAFSPLTVESAQRSPFMSVPRHSMWALSNPLLLQILQQYLVIWTSSQRTERYELRQDGSCCCKCIADGWGDCDCCDWVDCVCEGSWNEMDTKLSFDVGMASRERVWSPAPLKPPIRCSGSRTRGHIFATSDGKTR